MRVLIVEDDPDIGEVEKKLFADHDVVVVKNLHDALSAQIPADVVHLFPGHKPFDLVVLDLRLPIPDSQQFHDPADVINLMHEKFNGTPIVVISAFITPQLKELAEGYGMECIDKVKLSLSMTFLKKMLAAQEKSKHARAVLFAHHMVTKAAEIALADTAKMQASRDDPDQEEITHMDRMKARLYFLSGATVVMLPWVVIIFQMYCKAVLRDNEPIPYYTHILLFCGICVAAIIGVMPWIMKFFGAFSNAAGRLEDEDK